MKFSSRVPFTLLLGAMAGISGALLSASQSMAFDTIAPESYQNSACHGQLVFIGTEGSGPGRGIAAACFDPDAGRLTFRGIMAELPRPTWVLMHPRLPVLYSVRDPSGPGKSEARIVAMAVDRPTGKLTVLDEVPSGGVGAVFLSLDKNARTLLVANYASATIASIPVSREGRLTAPVSRQADYGTGPSWRQTKPHAHAVVPASSGKFVLVPDLGADRLFAYRLDSRTRKLEPADPPFLQVAIGSGPRHVAIHPNGRYVYLMNELRPGIDVLRWHGKEPRLKPIETIFTMRDDPEDQNKGGEIEISKDGRFVYTSNRGEDVLMVHKINLRTGKLKEVQRISAGGKSPFHFSFDQSGRWLLVANADSDTINVFRVDRNTGRILPANQSIKIANPTCVSMAPNYP